MKIQTIANSRYENNYIDEGIKCTLEEKRTKESFSELCNIDKILERHARTGQLPEQKPKQYGDFSSVPDYQTAFNVIQNAHNQFDSLDAKVRARFQNDPEAFLAFATNASNLDEMINLGLAPKKAKDTRQELPVANTASIEAVK